MQKLAACYGVMRQDFSVILTEFFCQEIGDKKMSSEWRFMFEAGKTKKRTQATKLKVKGEDTSLFDFRKLIIDQAKKNNFALNQFEIDVVSQRLGVLVSKALEWEKYKYGDQWDGHISFWFQK